MSVNYALTFPGQGSQRVGMLDDLLDSHQNIIRNTLDESSDAIGIDLLKLAQNGPEQDLNKTEITQPLMLASDIAIWRVLQHECNLNPIVLSGHSLGEYAALVVAESINLTDATKIVQHRGQLMQKAVPNGVGGVAAIVGLSDEKILTTCKQLSTQEIVSAVNFNAPGQVVIAGHKSKVEQAIEVFKKVGAKRTIMLPLSVPVHCNLLQPIATEFHQFLNQFSFNLPRTPIIHNVDANVRNTTSDIKDALTKQIYSPVRWVECVQALSQYSCVVAECGPSKILFGLNRRIDKQLDHFALYNHDSIKSFTSFLSTVKI